MAAGCILGDVVGICLGQAAGSSALSFEVDIPPFDKVASGGLGEFSQDSLARFYSEFPKRIWDAFVSCEALLQKLRGR